MASKIWRDKHVFFHLNNKHMVRDFIDPSELEEIKEKMETHETLHVFTAEEIETFNSQHMHLSIEAEKKRNFLTSVKEILNEDSVIDEDGEPQDILDKISNEYSYPDTNKGLKSINKELSSLMAKVKSGEEMRLVPHFVVNVPEESKKAIYQPNGHLLKVRNYYENEMGDDTGDLFSSLPVGDTEETEGTTDTE